MSDLRLGIDTTSAFLAVALWTPGEGALASIVERVERDHARRWIDAVTRTFASAGVSRRELTAVNVGIGPGSYTGTRIGIAAAKGIAFAAGIPLSGACSLAAMAWTTLAPGETGVATVDARRGAVYAAAFQRRDDALVLLDPPAKRDREEVRSAWPHARWIEHVSPDPVWIAARPPSDLPAKPVYL